MSRVTILVALLFSALLLPPLPADTLVCYWKMESTNGPVVVDSAAAGAATDDGIWVGTPAYSPAVFGNGLQLDGSAYLNVSNSIDTAKAGEDLTISVWCKVATWDTNWQTLLAKGENNRYRIARSNRDANKLSYSGGSGDIAGGAVNDGKWHHVLAVTENGVAARLYIDGVRVNNNGPATLGDSAKPLLIGANPESSTLRQWKGGIDDVGLFDEAFDDARAATLHALAKDPAYRYDLGTFNELLKAHAAGPGAPPLIIGPTVWVYAAADPGAGSGFFAFSSDGTGMVAGAPLISSFAASPAYLTGGQSSVLSWTADGFTALTLDDGSGPVSVSGQTGLTVTPAVTTTFTLTGTSALGNSTSTVTVFVDVPPVVELSASSAFIPTGADTTLRWTASGAATLVIDQGLGDVLPNTNPSGSGSRMVTGIASTTTYTITASNPAGTVTDTVTITTGSAPVINSFTIDEPSSVPGATVALAWNVSNADSVGISRAIGTVDPVAGTATDTPLTTTTYTLTATNPFGGSSATVTATVPKAIGLDAELWTVLQRTSTSDISNLAAADALLAGVNEGVSATATRVAVINYGSGNDGEFPGDSAPPVGYDLDDFVVRATATLVVNFPGEYAFGINNDDGGRLRIDGANVIVDDAQHGPLTTNGTVMLTGGNHTIEYIYFENGGGNAGEVFFINPDGRNEMLSFTEPVPPILTQSVIINEFMAANSATLRDSQGDWSDWIELYNGTGGTVDLAGYYLTDDPAWPGKYVIPSHPLAHGEFLVLFASGKNTIFGTDEFHTNFKLSTNGEYLGLYRDDGAGGFEVVSEFAPAFPPQVEDASYGTWGAGQKLGFMPVPTPGGVNFGGVTGFLGDTHFDVDRGLFATPFSLTITADHPAATIRYTLDGSEPTINHGGIFTAPITISQTTVVRAAAFLHDYQPTNIDTQTYIFPADVPSQNSTLAGNLGFPQQPVNNQVYRYGMDSGGVSDAEIEQALTDIPTISLVMDQVDFSSPASGIYSNANLRGAGWERPGSIELLNEDGLMGGQFQLNCGVRIRGGFSRSNSNPKHAFRLFFGNSYGGDLNYPIFQDEGPSHFENLDLRTSQNYSWAFQNSNQNTFLREIHGRDAQRDMHQPYTRSRYYHLYLNGIYWGLYMSQERAESSYAETYFGGNKDDYDVIKSSGNDANYVTEATDGDLNGAWLQLWTKVRAIRANPTDNAAYFALQGLAPDGLSPNPDPAANPDLLDVDNMIDYLLAIFYTGNFDAPLSTFISSSNNWFGIRDRNGTAGFRFFVHDGEHTLGTGANSNDRTGPWGDLYTDRPPSDFTRSNPQYLHEDLAWNEEYRIAFADRVHKHFFNGGAFSEPAALDRLNTRSLEIENAVRAELARWGGNFNYTTWLNARQDVVNFINAGVDGATSGVGRATYLVSLLRSYNHAGSKPLYPLIDAPQYSVNGGFVAAGFGLQITNPNASGVIYYTTDGSDPREPGGTTRASAGIASGPVTLTHSGPVKSRILDGVTWSALNDFEFIVGTPGSADNLVISELHYHPARTLEDTFADPEDYEFIELLNLSTTDPIELTGIVFEAGIGFDFTGSNVIRLAPGARVVVVGNLAAFTARYPLVPATLIAGEFTGNLDNAGERITLLDARGAILRDFSYSDQLPWPTAADGEGYSLVLNCDQTNPDPALPTNWRSHAILHGNPGGPDGTTWAAWVHDHGLSGADGEDSDHDTVTDAFEYAAGTNPLDPASKAPLVHGFQSFFVDGSFQQFSAITVRRNLAAGDMLCYPEVSSDLISWSSAPSDLIMIEAVNQGDGTEVVTWRTSLPAPNPGGGQRFMRLRMDAN